MPSADSSSGRKRGKRNRNVDDDSYIPDELAFAKADYFKVEKWLLTYGSVGQRPYGKEAAMLPSPIRVMDWPGRNKGRCVQGKLAVA